jgi:hypothetical protein
MATRDQSGGSISQEFGNRTLMEDSCLSKSPAPQGRYTVGVQ